MLRLPELIPFARKHGLTIISIEDLIAYRRSAEPTVRREAEVRLPTSFGPFTAYGYRSVVDGVEHVALVHGDIGDGQDVLVRVHSECLTGDIFQSQRCDCGPQLHTSMERITAEGRGVVVYLRGHEGRGIGLLSKLRAYELQERGSDTLDANLELGLPADARDYAAGAQILSDLGVRTLRLMTNNPDKTAALVRHGLEITGREPMPVQAGEHNLRYLRTKRDRMGHDLPWLDAVSYTQDMSGKGAPELSVRNCGDLRVAVIAAQWHEKVMDGLVDGALRALHDLGIDEPTLLRVPGSFELPVVAKVLAGRGYDAIVALGVIIRGGTPHFEYVSQGVTSGLTQVTVDTGVPVGFGVLTCDNEEQALDRAGLEGSNEDKGHEAVTAAVATAATLRTVSEPWR